MCDDQALQTKVWEYQASEEGEQVPGSGPSSANSSTSGPVSSRLEMDMSRRLSHGEKEALPCTSFEAHRKEDTEDEFVPDSEDEPDEPRDEHQHRMRLPAGKENKRQREESDEEGETPSRVCLRPRQDAANVVKCRCSPVRRRLAPISGA